MKRRLLVLVSVVLFVIGISGLAIAVPINFNFSATVDATDFGLSASEAVSIDYTYEPGTTPVHIDYGFRVEYGPVYGTLSMGGDTVTINGRASIRDESLPFGDADGYQFFAANYLVGTSLSGTINSIPVGYFSLKFLNQTTLDMLNSTDLPSSTSFVADADLMRLHFKHRYGAQEEVLVEFPSSDDFNFTAKPVPEPTTILLFGAGLVGLARFGRKKFKK